MTAEKLKDKMHGINLNDIIKVRLTDAGMMVHRQHMIKLCSYASCDISGLIEPEIDKNGYTEYQLWVFINIFGRYLLNGAEPLIENNLIFYESED